MARLRESKAIGKGAVRPIVPDFSRYVTVYRPERDERDWWVGGPGACLGPDGAIWIAARMRETYSPRGHRGYEVRILRSEDGVRFEAVNSIKREDIGTVSLERSSMLIDPLTGKFKLYLCRAGRPDFADWRIIKLEDVDDPAKFDPRTAKTVLSFPEGSRRGAKDPFVINIGGVYHMYTVQYGFRGQKELLFHSVSEDGEEFRNAPDEPCMRHEGWHDHYVRPSCLMPMGGVYVMYYEGSSKQWHDPVYNIALGLAVSTDLVHFVDVTPEEPLAKSPTPAGGYHTLRYMDYVCLEDRVLFYYEARNSDETNELRMTEVAL